jgi:hypothetical protein
MRSVRGIQRWIGYAALIIGGVLCVICFPANVEWRFFPTRQQWIWAATKRAITGKRVLQNWSDDLPTLEYMPLHTNHTPEISEGK